jgi:competence protein ComEA
MKRLLVTVCIGVAVLLALRRPAPAPAISAAVAAPAGMPVSQHFRKGQSSARLRGASVVYVTGAVAHPGLYSLATGARVNDAVRLAGGLRADADPAAVNLAERVTDGEEIDVLRVGQSPPSRTRQRARKSATRKRRLPDSGSPIDINTADQQSLATIPGIGPMLASRIVTYRRLNGPFASLDELADVAGMTQRRIDALAAYASVNTSQ